MIYFLFFFICFLVLLTYTYYKFDLLSPTIWLLFGWTLSVGFALVKYHDWGDITAKTVCVIIAGVFAFIIGGMFGSKIKANTFQERNSYLNLRLELGIGLLFFSLLFLAYTTVVDFRFVYRAAISVGFGGGANFLTYARDGMMNDIHMPYSIYIPIAFSQALAYVISHSIITSFVLKEKIRFKLLTFGCVALFLVLTLLSTGRTMIMHYLLFILADATIQMSSVYGQSRSLNRKIIKFGIIVIVAILLIFILIDVYLRASKYGTERNPVDQIIKYTSSGIYAFDKFLQNPTTDSETGYETLYNFYSILRRLGFDFEKTGNTLPFTNYANITTNVYTALRRYLHDYGMCGLIAIQFIMGAIYEFIYKKIKRGDSSIILFIMYCTFIFSPVFNCIEERFLINVLSLRSLMLFVFTYFILKIIPKSEISCSSEN